MKVRLLRQRNPAFHEKHIEECRALYEGGDAWRRLRARFIPQQEVEPDDLYQRRLEASTYTSHAGAICDLIASFLFSEPPTVANAPSAWWDKWQQNVDRQGTSVAWWARAAFVDALVGRRSWAWVNLPARPAEGFADALEQDRAGGLDAYLVALAPELVVDWGYDATGQLAWVLIEDELCERAGVDQERGSKLRWRYIDVQQIRTWIWTPRADHPKPLDDDEALEAPAVAHGIGRLPVVELTLPPGLYALGKLHDPAIDHLRARNGLSWALDKGAHPLLTIYSKDRHAPILGAGYYLRLDREDRAEYVEPSGTSFELLAGDVTRLREDLYRVVQQMATSADASATAAKQSGESKSKDWQAIEIVLAAYAELVLDWLRALYGLVADVRSEPVDKMQISGLAGWQSDDLSTWLEQAAQAIDARSFSPTFKKTVAKREAARLLAEEDPKVLETINSEIDAAEAVDPAPYVPPPRGALDVPDPRHPRPAGD